MYLILEFAPNGNLHHHLSSIRTGDSNQIELGERYLSPTEILSYASQIAKGMEYLTSKNVNMLIGIVYKHGLKMAYQNFKSMIIF